MIRIIREVENEKKAINIIKRNQKNYFYDLHTREENGKWIIFHYIY